MSYNLDLESHVSAVSAARFFISAPIRRIRQSLDAASTATLILIHTSLVDYCNEWVEFYVPLDA